jgi:DUF971 family protein
VRSPVSIKRNASNALSFTWDDGKIIEFPLNFLRDECPCAGCKGESGLLGVYYQAPEQKILPGRYDLTNLQAVGKYAIQLSWGDGHDTGLYSWEYLAKLESQLRGGSNGH